MKRIGAFFGLLALAVLFAGCGGEDVLLYQQKEIDLRVSYENGGVGYLADLHLAAGSGEREATLTLLSPPEVSGVTYRREGGTCTVSRGEVTAECGETEAFLPVSLFEIPRTARVTGVEKEGDTRTVTLTEGDTVYTLRFAGDREIPVFLAKKTGDDYFAVTAE